MSEPTEVPAPETPIQRAVRELKAKYGRLVVAEIGGETLAFKPLNKAKIADLKKNITQKPEIALELSVNACEFSCVLGESKVKELSELYPLAFAGSIGAPGVIDYLFELARGRATITIE
jgi:hypothetical protein